MGMGRGDVSSLQLRGKGGGGGGRFGFDANIRWPLVSSLGRIGGHHGPATAVGKVGDHFGKVGGGGFGSISQYAQTMPTIDDERYRSKKWLRDVGKDFDMMRMRTMAMNDGDDGDDDGAWLNCDTTIALRSEVRHHCGTVMGFSCKCFDLHCLQ